MKYSLNCQGICDEKESVLMQKCWNVHDAWTLASGNGNKLFLNKNVPEWFLVIQLTHCHNTSWGSILVQKKFPGKFELNIENWLKPDWMCLLALKNQTENFNSTTWYILGICIISYPFIFCTTQFCKYRHYDISRDTVHEAVTREK